MDYFSILNLQEEPFSNSPDPQFFFQSRMHQGCLQKLELSIRLRRGMSVVLGEVGTGKTTLCRHLIRELAGDAATETHVILDPGFPDSRSFLHFLASTFHLPSSSGDADNDWRIKNEIQEYLFRRGVEEGKILVLIIDEGQKIDTSSLEILRELLNYETNARKLLQIVIFAQTEFENTLAQHPNFSDRISLFVRLGPLGLRETRALIRYRLGKASSGQLLPELFSPLAYFAIHRATGGYPRKIIHLCHRVLLAMIVQNRSRAGWSVVRWSAKMCLPSKKPRKLRPLKLATSFLILALAGFLGGTYSQRYLSSSPPGKWKGIALDFDSLRFFPVASGPEECFFTAAIETECHEQESTGAASLSQGGPDEDQGSTQAVKPRTRPDQEDSFHEAPKFLGQITITEGETLEGLIRHVYGAFTPTHLKAVRRSNPHVRQVRRVEAGTAIRFPVLDPAQRRTASGYCVALTVTRDLADCYDFLRALRNERTLEGIKLFIQTLLPEQGNRRFANNKNGRSHPLTLLPFWNPADGLRFAIVLKAVFPDSASAARVLENLPRDWVRDGAILGEWQEGTLFYSEELPTDRQRG